MEEDLKALQVLVKEIVNNFNTLLDRKKVPCVKQGRIIKKTGNLYEVEVEGQSFNIKSQLTFVVNDRVGVLTNSRLTGDKYLLG